ANQACSLRLNVVSRDALDVAGHISHSSKICSVRAYLDVEIPRVQQEVIAARAGVLHHESSDADRLPEIHSQRRIRGRSAPLVSGTTFCAAVNRLIRGLARVTWRASRSLTLQREILTGRRFLSQAIHRDEVRNRSHIYLAIRNHWRTALCETQRIVAAAGA